MNDVDTLGFFPAAHEAIGNMASSKLRMRDAALRARSQVEGTKRPDNSFSTPRRPRKLLTFHELPAWYQENPDCLLGYRPESRSFLACINSLCYWHNETLNIFTHLVPALFIFCIYGELHRLIKLYFPNATTTDKIVFDINLFAAATTALLSSAYHTFYCHSQQIANLWLRIDYLGIVLLIYASFISGIYVGFYREPYLQKVYWSMITVLIFVAGTVNLHPRFAGIQWRKVKMMAFVLTAASGFAPIIHGVIKHGFHESWARSGMPYWLMEGVAYGLGAFFFGSKFPECWDRKGRFDFFGSSHQIFHVCVVIGAVVHLVGVWRAWYGHVSNAII